MIFELLENEVFVFGSNDQGLHVGGAARQAMRWGAKMGKCIGLMGNTYGIITIEWKTGNFIGWDKIAIQLEEFCSYAKENPELKFLLTPIGTGIAGGKIEDLNQIINKIDLPSNVEKLW